MKEYITIYLVTFITPNKEYSYEYATKEDLDAFVKDIISQIEQNSYNDGFICLYADDTKTENVRVSEIRGIDTDKITLSKREYEKLSRM